MLYNRKWDRQTAEADLSLMSLIAWLEQQPPEKTYPYAEPGHCVLAQWLRSMDPEATVHPANGTFAYRFRGKVVQLNHYHPIAIPPLDELKADGIQPFGAALERARS